MKRIVKSLAIVRTLIKFYVRSSFFSAASEGVLIIVERKKKV